MPVSQVWKGRWFFTGSGCFDVHPLVVWCTLLSCGIFYVLIRWRDLCPQPAVFAQCRNGCLAMFILNVWAVHCADPSTGSAVMGEPCHTIAVLCLIQHGEERVCFTLKIRVQHAEKSGKEHGSWNWSRAHGRVPFDFLLIAFSVCFLMHPMTTCLGVALP